MKDSVFAITLGTIIIIALNTKTIGLFFGISRKKTTKINSYSKIDKNIKNDNK